VIIDDRRRRVDAKEGHPMPEIVSLRNSPRPIDATSFVGRKAELETARRILASARLLTITGPNGVGKSRFAAKLIEQMDRMLPDAAVRLDLGAAALPPNQSSEREWPTDRLRAHAGLVLLDDAADRADARALAERILADCTDAIVVVTSTTVLGVAGEHLLELRPFVVPPRGLASSRTILEWDAARLLVDRIRALDPRFALTASQLPVVRDICADSDGLPALIELAAAATRFLSIDSVRDALHSPDSLVDLLPAAAPIAGSAAAVIASCDDAERRVLAVASLLREPLTMDCLVSLLTGDDADASGFVGAFCRLVDRSVLISDPDVDGAFRMLRSVARMGRAALDATGETAGAIKRFDRHLVDLMTEFASAPAGPAEVPLARHLLNHRRGLERLLSRYANDPETAEHCIRLIVALRRHWSALGLVSEVQVWLEQAIACRPQRDALLGEALRAGAFFSILESNFRRSAELLAEELRLPEDQRDASGLSPEFLQALNRVGDLDLDGAETLLEEVVERTRSNGQVELLGEQLYFLTLIKVLRGDHEQAEQDLSSSVPWMRARGNRWGIAHALVLRSISLLNRGFNEHAGETAREALLMMDALGDRVGFPTCLRILAVLAARRDDAVRATTLFAAASRMDGSRTMARDAIAGGAETSLRRALGARKFSRLSARGRQIERRELIQLALDDGGADRTARPTSLTRRESEIAELLVEGLSSAQIAARLVLSTRTVEGHIQRMLHKLNFRSRSQIAVWMSDQFDVAGGRVLAS
jgi:non-specific serine/threonine protein kinase